MNAWRWLALVSLTAAGACSGTPESSGRTGPSAAVDDDELQNGRKCAGPDGLLCPTGKYCATDTPLETNSRCPGDEIAGACRRIPQTCVHIYLPTCGCDGQTYDNDCNAAAAGVAIAYEGPCAPFCGGFAGIRCPGAGTCEDNPSDACDSAEGDVDCASLCRCEREGLCTEGYHWDSSPEVCDCVTDDS